MISSHKGAHHDAATQQAIVDLCADLVSLNTVDPPGNELAAARLVAGVLRQAGIDAEIDEFAPGRANLVARLYGRGESGALVMCAHFDTIDADPLQWTVPPFTPTVRKDRLYGRGTTDMKSAIAAMVHTAIALKRTSKSLRGDLVLAFTAAENTTCAGAHRLVERGVLEGASALLIGEPSSLDIFIAEKGALWLKATAHGEYGHNAFSEQRSGDRGSAIIRMAEFLTRLKGLTIDAPAHPHLGPPTINVGLVSGGLARPLIAPECTAEIDIRTVPGMEVDDVISQFQEIAGPHVSIEFLDFKPPIETDQDHPFVRACARSVADVTSTVPRITGVAYYTDGAILAPAYDLPMVILGPGEFGRSGSIDEYVCLKRLATCADAYLGLAHNLLIDDGASGSSAQ